MVAIAVSASPSRRRVATAAPGAAVTGPSWWPDWRTGSSGRRRSCCLAANSIYFAVNAFLPGYLTYAGRPDLIRATLTANNLGQLPASFILLGLRGPARAPRLAVYRLRHHAAHMPCRHRRDRKLVDHCYAGVLGFIGGVVLTLGFALPALLAAPSDVARMAAAMFTISYSEGLIISVLSGAAWDITGSPRYSFLVMCLAALAAIDHPGVHPLFRPRALPRNRIGVRHGQSQAHARLLGLRPHPAADRRPGEARGHRSRHPGAAAARRRSSACWSDQEFQVSELSLASYAALKARGDCPFVAVPVALSKIFRHSCIYVRPGAGIGTPQDLQGQARRHLAICARPRSCFMRGMLQHDYGVEAEDMHWFMGGLNTLRASRR